MLYQAWYHGDGVLAGSKSAVRFSDCYTSTILGVYLESIPSHALLLGKSSFQVH